MSRQHFMDSVRSILNEAARQIKKEQEVMNKFEAAEFLRVKLATLERLAFKLHEIPYSKPGKHAVFLKRDLMRFLLKRRTPSVYD